VSNTGLNKGLWERVSDALHAMGEGDGPSELMPQYLKINIYVKI